MRPSTGGQTYILVVISTQINALMHTGPCWKLHVNSCSGIRPCRSCMGRTIHHQLLLGPRSCVNITQQRISVANTTCLWLHMLYIIFHNEEDRTCYFPSFCLIIITSRKQQVRNGDVRESGQISENSSMWKRKKAQRYCMILGKALKTGPNVNVKGAKRRTKAFKEYKRRLMVARVSHTLRQHFQEDAREFADEADSQGGSVHDCPQHKGKNSLVTKAWLRTILLHPSDFCSAVTRMLSMLKMELFPKLILRGHQVEPNSHKKRAPSSA